MNAIRTLVMASMALAGAAVAQPASAPPLLAPGQGEAIAAELSGRSTLATVRQLSNHHRMRGSAGFRAAAESIAERLRGYGLEGVEIIALPADGTIFYGTQRSRPGWDARFAELWDGRERIASWAEQPISLAQDSVSGRVETELVDIGAGTSEGDYRGKDVRGKLVLTSSQPEAVQALAIGRFGAVGIVSWAQNQRTAWWGEDESLVRWGHLGSFSEHPTFAFMVSPRQARAWQERLARGDAVRLRAEVEAGQSPSAYLIPTALIPGRRRDQEIVYSCHLDHPNPGANDNASGCAGLLEIARGLSRLIREGRLPRPERTLRFIWPAEIEGTIALLNARPEFARRTVATIHLDMIGGDTEITKSILRVEGSPPSLPTAIPEVAFALARFVNAQSLAFAGTGTAELPLVEADGSRRALQAEIGGFSEGSDHQVWAEGSFRIPVIYIADWPDRYIHTQRDLPENLDPTKLRRAIFIAGAAGYHLANRPAFETVAPLAAPAARSGPVYRRIRRDGPMNGFGYSWLDDQLARSGRPRPSLLAREAPRDRPSFGYEALNLVDGRRSVGEIRAILAATVGEAPIEEVAEYLASLAQLRVLEPVR